ncbi:hypothetical protein GALMADRAFT_931883 [Galerina marginata CBS 339.88]|uniref:Uncharacterized protein n=1 Tax=Galerina marginata (strain CBS 339.88) TaxID=685588 RepID=A0A067SH77_GALM3|nr:hypothetical protein GALMADRAFT_931883 [Galerina marginata CBS 339.88]
MSAYPSSQQPRPRRNGLEILTALAFSSTVQCPASFSNPDRSREERSLDPRPAYIPGYTETPTTLNCTGTLTRLFSFSLSSFLFSMHYFNI